MKQHVEIRYSKIPSDNDFFKRKVWCNESQLYLVKSFVKSDDISVIKHLWIATFTVVYTDDIDVKLGFDVFSSYQDFINNEVTLVVTTELR